MDYYYSSEQYYFADANFISGLPWLTINAGHDYSLVDSRCRPVIHWMSAASRYRMALPILMKGGPSPRIRAFASQDRLTLRSRAASFGVNRTTGPSFLVGGLEFMLFRSPIRPEGIGGSRQLGTSPTAQCFERRSRKC
jgi:hypothetical protein